MKRVTSKASTRATSAAGGRRSPARKPPRTRIIDLVPAVMKIRNLLVPVDFSPSSNKALAYALSFAEQFGAKVTLMNVVEPAVFPTDSGEVPAEIDDLYRSMQNAARERLAEIAARRIPERFRANALVRVGRPHREITRTARQLRSDLIVIATHGYAEAKQSGVGSTAERVVRHAPCPVLTVREREHDFV